jgi:hypothetical protein
MQEQSNVEQNNNKKDEQQTATTQNLQEAINADTLVTIRGTLSKGGL